MNLWRAMGKCAEKTNTGEGGKGKMVRTTSHDTRGGARRERARKYVCELHRVFERQLCGVLKVPTWQNIDCWLFRRSRTISYFTTKFTN
jgi:hypothetical protein